MSTRTRHWKQHWDPSADLIFRKRLRIGDDPEKPFALPGEMVTSEHRAKLGLARLRRWFDNGTLALANFVAPEPQRELALRVNSHPLTHKLETEGLVTRADVRGQ